MRIRSTYRLAGPLLAAALMAGCGSAPGSPSSHPPLRPAATARPTATATQIPVPAAVSKMLLFVFENHSQSQVLASMPYLSSLARRYGRTTHYDAITHPSLPNYLALVGGSTFGVHDDNAPGSHHLRGGSVLDQALRHGMRAKVYAESMPGNCTLVAAGAYGVKHNPWAYFSGSRQRRDCRRHDVPMGTRAHGVFARDLVAGTLPQVGLAVPDICHDAHDCSLSIANHWLHRWMRKVMAGPDYRTGRLAVVVTFDEDDGTTTNRILTTVISRHTHHERAAAHYTHYSWLRCTESILGLPLLRRARTARNLCPAFHL